MADQKNRYIPAHADAFQYPLPNLAERLRGQEPIRIVAIGSSSTEGEGNIVPYPSRLKMQLSGKYPNRSIVVVNRGIGGEEARKELERMQHDVIAEVPVLTIWQVGTNAVWQPDFDLDDVAAAIQQGLSLLAGATPPMDVVLMDLQYAPALLTDDNIDATRRMLSLIEQVATAARVNVFRRFDLMRRFIEAERHSFDTIIDPTDPDRLHQSDFSAGRIGYELCQTILSAAALTPAV